MTDEQRLQCELKHLLNLCRPPLTAYWEPVATRKAAMLAQWDKAYAELPALLAKGLRDLSKSTSTAASTAEPEKSNATAD